MHVAVIGGTGFVGKYLVSALLAAGHVPSVLVRKGSENRIDDPDSCRLVSGDLMSPVSVMETLKNCDAAIYNVGILRERPGAGITFEEAHYACAVRVLETAEACGISRFLLMSANGVKPNGTPYQQTKYRAEETLLASRLDVTVFRPSVIFGDPTGRDEIASRLYRQMIAPPLPALGFYPGLLPSDREIEMSPVHADDVADAFVAALDDDSTFGATLEIGGPEVLTWVELLERIALATGRDKWIVPMPTALMKIPAVLLGWLPFFPVTLDQLRMLEEGNRADSGSLEALIRRPARAFDKESLAYLN